MNFIRTDKLPDDLSISKGQIHTCKSTLGKQNINLILDVYLKRRKWIGIKVYKLRSNEINEIQLDADGESCCYICPLDDQNT